MIYICVPTYNEARTVGVLLWKVRQVMAEFPRDYRVLVADDGSTDATPEVLAPYTRVLPLTVYRHDERHGYAASTEMLLREVVRRSDYPRRDIVITLQADFTEEPEEIPTLVRRIEGGADVVTGALTMRDAHAPRSVRWTHKLLGYLVRRGGWPDAVSDPLSGFRAYRVITVKRVLDERNGRPLFHGEGWAANVELLRAVVPFARRVDEAPVAIRYDRRFRETRFRPWETVRGILTMLRSKPVADSGAVETAAGRVPVEEAGWEEVRPGAARAGSEARERENGERRRAPGRGRGAQRRTGGARGSGEEGAAERPARRGGPSGRRRADEAVAGEEGGGREEGRRGGGASRGPGAEGREGREGGRRQRGSARRRPVEAVEEGGAPVVEGGVEATVGTEQGSGESPRRRRGGRPRRRPAGGGGAREPGAPEGGARAGEAGGAGSSSEGVAPGSPASEEGGAGRPAGDARRRARRGGRRGGRRTGARRPGTAGEEPSSGSAAEE